MRQLVGVDADMSRISNRVSTIAAALAIVLLVILLVILWTGVRTTDRIEGIGDLGKNTVRIDVERFPVFLAPQGPATTGKTTEENLTNEVVPREENDSKENKSATEALLSTKGDLEYIRPMKISQNQYEDPLEEFSTAKRHHSGHFRHATAEVWDPHPQYEFTAFGRRFRLRLAHDSSFVSSNMKITHISENTTRREHSGHELGCYYSGTVDDDPKSAVTVSLCHGMTGHMRTSHGSYLIKPAEQWQENSKDSLETSLQHAIQRLPSPKSSSNFPNDADDQPVNRNCGVIDYDTNDAPAALTDDSSSGRIYVGSRSRERRSLTEKISLHNSRGDEYQRVVGQREDHRNFLRNNQYDRYYSVERRRSYSEEDGQDSEMESDPFVTWRPRRALPREYFIEIMVVADAKMVKYHGKGLTSYILVLMSTVSRIYKDQSIGNPVSIAVMKIVQTDEVFGVRHSGTEGIAAAEMLKRFCHWQKTTNPDEPSPEHHDTALLLTRENLCHNPGQMRCDTLGLAELGRMCSPGSSCAIVQDNGLAAAFTIAHEIGHVLNMPHDDDAKCRSFRNRSGVHNVMSRMLDDNTFPWEWSKCSRHYVTEFLESGPSSDCLLDEPMSTMKQENLNRLPGEDYSENRQCELVFGPGSRICSHMVSDVCRRLWCTVPNLDNRQQCHTQHMPWADGTACGVDKWCHRGECVSRRNLKPVNGQWGEWGRFGECSRTCGGGIKKKYRECNNPPPQNGGNYCAGERVKHRSCGTRECPPGTPDFREQQCSKFDNDNKNIKNLARDVKWHAKYTRILPQDRCKLYCQLESNQYYMLEDKVIDGTPCGLDTFDICVNGRCQPAGCDHVLNSTAELDICGVCKGDNSTCQMITGSYNSTIYGYTRVAKIPAGSNNIEIRQHSWMGSHNDSNYLALRLGEDGEYILNGKFMVMHRKVIVQPGVTIEYSGPESIVERLNSSRPIATDLILEILSVENYPPQITYEYTVPKSILKSYIWLLSDWSDCSLTCQGMKYRKAECRSSEHKDVVSDDYCREDKPQGESKICNDYCTLHWQVTSESECSSHCGPGVRKVTSRCLQSFANSYRPPRQISAAACSHLERPKEEQVCFGLCKDAHWSYGEWESCSVTCGGGLQIRTASCVDATGRPVAEDACIGQEKQLMRLCGHDPCPRWFLGEWSQCSASCGVGKRQRRYWCHVENQVVPDGHCGSTPTVTEVCDAGPCPQWQAGEWSPCTVTCGEGTVRRKIVCNSGNGSVSDKCEMNDKPEDTKKCALKPCPIVDSVPPAIVSHNLISYLPRDLTFQQDNEIGDVTYRSGYEWKVGSYEECSRSCVDGFVNRVVKCVSIQTGAFVHNYHCDRNKKPLTKVACNRHRCPSWNTGDWSLCDVECDYGFQHRQVRCQSPQGEMLPDRDCSYREKPEDIKSCRKNSCTTTAKNDSNRLESSILRRWRTSKWTACSKSCGSGIQTRRVECTMRRGNHGPEIPVREEQCSKLGLTRPKAQRNCRRVACDYVWQEGTWSECSAECGDGIQRREVTCHRVNRYGWTDPTPSDSGCPLDQKPLTEQRCKVRECNAKYYWTTGPWKKCSHECGRKGHQRRRIFCHDSTGKKVARFHCPVELRPHGKQKCNQKMCGPASCLDVRKRSKAHRDGEYSIVVGGRSTIIYCHGIATAEPKEYLTLPAGGRENYAEIYDKRLKNPQSCPYNGRRNDSCDCTTDVEFSGRTMFRRVRIDPVRLNILANDYTFTWTEGAKRVEYGKAGDCYSRSACPQGRFSINLSGTQFKLSTDVIWRTEVAGASMEIDRISDQLVVGKCGGLCGFCKPKTGLKLDVLPP